MINTFVLPTKPAYPRTYGEFCAWFPDEQACASYLERLRWPLGFRCPQCDCARGWRTHDGRWACSGCARKVSITAGTAFDRSRITLHDWFAAAWYITGHEVSTLGLQQLMGLANYRTAWTILQKLRTGLTPLDQDRLRGLVKVFESCVGGMEAGADERFTVALAIEILSPEELGRVRLQLVDRLSSGSVVAFICAAVEPGSEVYTLDTGEAERLCELGYKHHNLDSCSAPDGATGSVPDANGVVLFFNRWLQNAQPSGSALTARQLEAYLNEFQLCFNRRPAGQRGLLFFRVLRHAILTPPTRYRRPRFGVKAQEAELAKQL